MIPVPSILDRSKGYMTLQFINDPDILGYRIRVSNSLNNAYGAFNGVGGVGTEAIFDINRGQTLRTKAIRLKGLGVSGDITRGQTRATYDHNGGSAGQPTHVHASSSSHNSGSGVPWWCVPWDIHGARSIENHHHPGPEIL
jgi:hypothetical protein